jgi:uncharacterized protein (TIGR02271 family)
MQYRTEDPTPDQRAEISVPLAAEEIAVKKQVVETSRVQVARLTREREQLIDETLARQTAEISRTAIGQFVDSIPPIKEEGDAVIIPIVEERLVVERRLFLKEEVRIQRVRTTERHQKSVTLRYQEAVVRRLPVEAPDREKPDSSANVQQSSEE